MKAILEKVDFKCLLYRIDVSVWKRPFLFIGEHFTSIYSLKKWTGMDYDFIDIILSIDLCNARIAYSILHNKIFISKHFRTAIVLCIFHPLFSNFRKNTYYISIHAFIGDCKKVHSFRYYFSIYPSDKFHNAKKRKESDKKNV